MKRRRHGGKRIQVKTWTMTLDFVPAHSSNQALRSWSWSWSWPGSAYRGWLRRFLLLKLATVLLFPHTASLPLLVGCVFSLQALLLLRSPRVSTKPSTLLLGRLAMADCLVLLSWTLRLTAATPWWREAAAMSLLDAHHLASLLLLGLLGLEATLLSRWPQQTRRFRTSHWAQLGCGLVWVLVLLELVFSLIQDSRAQISQNPSVAFSSYLRRTLWVVNVWLHYGVLNSRPQKRETSYH